MHKVRLIFAISLFIPPIGAQTNQASLLGGSKVSANLTPPHNNNTILIQPQATAPAGSTLYRWSIAAVLAGSVADAASGWRAEEANPLLAGSGKQFGAQSIAIKSGFMGVSLAIQYIVLQHRPDFHKRMAWMNLITAGALGGVAGHNVGVR